jgi:CHAT domain-containing protein
MSEPQKFSLDLLQAVADNNGNVQIVHQFFDEHFDDLNENLLAALPQQFEIFLTQKDESDWKYSIATIVSLANELQQFPRGNRSIHLELSVFYYTAALTVRTLEAFPADWAVIQNNLALAYSNRIRGERAENIELAISYYTAALKVYTSDTIPDGWTAIQNNLGLAYYSRIRGERAENIELAISHYKAALTVRTPETFPADWAATQNNLAAAYVDRIRGEWAENIELAISYYKAALRVRTPEAFPEDWAMTQNNLANAYVDRIRGERAENIELAISYYTAALRVYTPDTIPDGWAMTQNNLANAYVDRIRGHREENIELAISYYTAALRVYTPHALPEDWAMTQNNLAEAYRGRIRGERAENIELAISHYTAALRVRTHDAFPKGWAMTQNNLAAAYSVRLRGARAENIELAISHYTAALRVRTSEAFPIEWASTQNNLAATYKDRIRGEQAENIEQAISGFKNALKVRQPHVLPLDCLQTTRNLGNLQYKLANWQQAIDAYETAMQAVETSRSWVVNEENRQQLLKDAISIYENAIQCAINLGNYAQAIQYTERIRSRQLVDLMGTKDLYPDAEIPAQIQQYLDEYEQLNRQIQHLREHGSPDSDGTTKTTRNAASLSRDNTTILALEAQKRAQYLKIRAFDPAIAGQIAVEPIDFAAIQKLITTPHTAILTCYTTDNDTHIFIIKQGQQPMLHTCTSQGWKELQQWLQTEWVMPYQENNSIWQQNLPTLLAEISQRLQLDTLIKEHLTDITELIIVPHLNLHQIPFAALPINPTQNKASENPLLGGVPAGWGGSFLGDKFIIRSIPSCQILQYCQQRKPITTKHIGTVEDAEDNLLGARYEGEQIAALYSIPTANRLRGSAQATVANYRELLTRVNRLHSSHHAISRPDNPIESAIIFANGERITLGDLLLGKRYRDTLDEVFLSACETHVGTATLTDDVATLTTGFLCIGARSVQSTLWSVDDLVTAIFDIFYHQERRDDRSRAFSLRAAQFRLRNFSGSEFKLRFYDELIEHFNKNSPAMITDLKQQCKKLNAQQSTLNNDTEEWQKLAETMKSLIRKIKSIESIPAVLNDYCTTDRPFVKPYYWAAFITQGMA